jgi:glycerate kinase
VRSEQPRARVRAGVLIPRRALLVSGAFSPRLPAEAVAAAVARGLLAGGAPQPDVAVLAPDGAAEIASQLAQLAFDARTREARAVIIAVAALDLRSLERGAAFEIATRARQAGVPAYAIARESRLSSFDARVLDLQLVLLARGARALSAAGARLAGVL